MHHRVARRRAARASRASVRRACAARQERAVRAEIAAERVVHAHRAHGPATGSMVSFRPGEAIGAGRASTRHIARVSDAVGPPLPRRQPVASVYPSTGRGLVAAQDALRPSASVGAGPPIFQAGQATVQHLRRADGRSGAQQPPQPRARTRRGPGRRRRPATVGVRPRRRERARRRHRDAGSGWRPVSACIGPERSRSRCSVARRRGGAPTA